MSNLYFRISVHTDTYLNINTKTLTQVLVKNKKKIIFVYVCTIFVYVSLCVLFRLCYYVCVIVIVLFICFLFCLSLYVIEWSCFCVWYSWIGFCIIIESIQYIFFNIVPCSKRITLWICLFCKKSCLLKWRGHQNLEFTQKLKKLDYYENRY